MAYPFVIFAAIKKGTMKKIALRIICALLCIFTSLAANATPYRCIASKLNIRDTADKSGRVIGQIAQNETVDILSVDGKRGAVLINGDTGYVSMDYMEPFETSSSQGDSVEKPWRCTTSHLLDLRGHSRCHICLRRGQGAARRNGGHPRLA